ncbi:MAG: transposase [Aeromonas sobria]
MIKILRGNQSAGYATSSIPPYTRNDHNSLAAAEYPNVRVVKLPLYSPELNPVEQVWSWLRQHGLANRTFKGYEDLLDACSDAWQRFIADAERVKSLCQRSWATLTQ